MIPGAMALAGISYRADFRASDLVSMTHASRILAPHLLSQKCENRGISVIRKLGVSTDGQVLPWCATIHAKSQ